MKFIFKIINFGRGLIKQTIVGFISRDDTENDLINFRINELEITNEFKFYPPYCSDRVE